MTSSLWSGHNYRIIFEDIEQIHNQRRLKSKGATEIIYLKYVILQTQLHSLRTFDPELALGRLLGSKNGKM